MSSGNEFETVRKKFGFSPIEVLNCTFLGYSIDKYVGHGTIGVVFHGINKDIGDTAAIKIIPRETLKVGWETEVKKLSKLEGIPQVVQCKGYRSEILPKQKVPVICIAYQFIEGHNLKQYTESHPELITLEFVESLLIESLKVFKACKTTGIEHGDLHEGNILIANADDRFLTPSPRIMINDFGVGGSTNKLDATNDYLQLGRIATNLIRKYVDPARLSGEGRFVRDRLLNDFLGKQLIEKNPTVGEYVKNPGVLYKNLLSIREDYNQNILKSSVKLHRPFDYLSCEQIGDSFELLETLYSKNFPGYDDLLERTNTILTGPRGCGKSTIFRNLSFKTQLLSGKSGAPNQFVGIYYNCNDLYYAFPYTVSNLDESARKVITHYFNLSILCEILDTFSIFEEKFEKLPQSFYDKLQGFLGAWFEAYEPPPSGLSLLANLLSQTITEKEKFRAQIAEKGVNFQPSTPLPQDFLQRLCSVMQLSIPWLTTIPFYFFLDDYSTPRVSKEIQMTLNCFVLTRYSELFFKISTESIVSIFPFDATGKMLEQTREYDVIDLGDYFLFSDDEKASAFLREIINNRLQNAVDFDWDNKDIKKILGDSQYSSSNELALAIKNGEHVLYSGWDTVVELCSGDIANILRMIRNMFTQTEKSRNEISKETQNKVIRETGNNFLNNIESIQDTGRQLRKIVKAFGDVANYYLKTRTSTNVDQEPQMQASRIEVRENPSFEIDGKQKVFSKTDVNAKKNYEDLIKYGIFIRDVRGKSIRGAVVPRLYLRRLLIPTFVLTPSKRDSISLESSEFNMLLSNPEEFTRHMLSKRPKKKTVGSPIRKGQKRFE